MIDQISKVSYCASSFFKTAVVEEAARILVNSTDGHMTRAYIVNSGQPVVFILMRTPNRADYSQDRRQWRQP